MRLIIEGCDADEGVTKFSLGHARFVLKVRLDLNLVLAGDSTASLEVGVSLCRLVGKGQFNFWGLLLQMKVLDFPVGDWHILLWFEGKTFDFFPTLCYTEALR